MEGRYLFQTLHEELQHSDGRDKVKDLVGVVLQTITTDPYYSDEQVKTKIFRTRRQTKDVDGISVTYVGDDDASATMQWWKKYVLKAASETSVQKKQPLPLKIDYVSGIVISMERQSPLLRIMDTSLFQDDMVTKVDLNTQQREEIEVVIAYYEDSTTIQTNNINVAVGKVVSFGSKTVYPLLQYAIEQNLTRLVPAIVNEEVTDKYAGDKPLVLAGTQRFLLQTTSLSPQAVKNIGGDGFHGMKKIIDTSFVDLKLSAPSAGASASGLAPAPVVAAENSSNTAATTAATGTGAAAATMKNKKEDKDAAADETNLVGPIDLSQVPSLEALHISWRPDKAYLSLTPLMLAYSLQQAANFNTILMRMTPPLLLVMNSAPLVLKCTLNNPKLYDTLENLHGLTDLTLDLPHASGVVPAVLFTLTSLKRLCLKGCHYSSIPDSIGDLASLQELNLANMPLTYLPVIALSKLSAIARVDCTGLKVASPPREIIARGPEAVAQYIHDLGQGAAPNNDVLLMLIGDGEAGKTSTLLSLKNTETNTARAIGENDRTVGIDISSFHPKPQISPLQFFAWDFGGQGIYAIMQQLFVSRRALYPLLWRVRQSLDVSRFDAAIKCDVCKKLLRTHRPAVSTSAATTSTTALPTGTGGGEGRGGDSEPPRARPGRQEPVYRVKGQGLCHAHCVSYEPLITSWTERLQFRVPGVPLVLIATHIDCATQEEVDEQCLEVEKVVQRLIARQTQTMTDGIPPLRIHNNGKSFRINNVTGEGVPELRDELCKIAENLDFYGEVIPASYVNIREKLRLMQVKPAAPTPAIADANGGDAAAAVSTPCTTSTTSTNWRTWMLWSEYAALAQECGIANESALRLATQFFHDMGELRYFGNTDVVSSTTTDPSTSLSNNNKKRPRRGYDSDEDSEDNSDCEGGEFDEQDTRGNDAEAEAEGSGAQAQSTTTSSADQVTTLLNTTVFPNPFWIVDVLRGLIRHDHADVLQRIKLDGSIDNKLRKSRRRRVYRLMQRGILHASLLPYVWAGVAGQSADTAVNNDEFARLIALMKAFDILMDKPGDGGGGGGGGDLQLQQATGVSEWIVPCLAAGKHAHTMETNAFEDDSLPFMCRLVYDALPPYFDMILVAHIMNSSLAESVDFIEGAAAFQYMGERALLFAGLGKVHDPLTVFRQDQLDEPHLHSVLKEDQCHVVIATSNRRMMIQLIKEVGKLEKFFPGLRRLCALFPCYSCRKTRQLKKQERATTAAAATAAAAAAAVAGNAQTSPLPAAEVATAVEGGGSEKPAETAQVLTAVPASASIATAVVHGTFHESEQAGVQSLREAEAAEIRSLAYLPGEAAGADEWNCASFYIRHQEILQSAWQLCPSLDALLKVEVKSEISININSTKMFAMYNAGREHGTPRFYSEVLALFLYLHRALTENVLEEEEQQQQAIEASTASATSTTAIKMDLGQTQADQIRQAVQEKTLRQMTLAGSQTGGELPTFKSIAKFVAKNSDVLIVAWRLCPRLSELCGSLEVLMTSTEAAMRDANPTSTKENKRRMYDSDSDYDSDDYGQKQQDGKKADDIEGEELSSMPARPLLLELPREDQTPELMHALRSIVDVTSPELRPLSSASARNNLNSTHDDGANNTTTNTNNNNTTTNNVDQGEYRKLLQSVKLAIDDQELGLHPGDQCAFLAQTYGAGSAECRQEHARLVCNVLEVVQEKCRGDEEDSPHPAWYEKIRTFAGPFHPFYSEPRVSKWTQAYDSANIMQLMLQKAPSISHYRRRKSLDWVAMREWQRIYDYMDDRCKSLLTDAMGPFLTTALEGIQLLEPDFKGNQYPNMASALRAYETKYRTYLPFVATLLVEVQDTALNATGIENKDHVSGDAKDAEDAEDDEGDEGDVGEDKKLLNAQLWREVFPRTEKRDWWLRREEQEQEQQQDNKDEEDEGESSMTQLENAERLWLLLKCVHLIRKAFDEEDANGNEHDNDNDHDNNHGSVSSPTDVPASFMKSLYSFTLQGMASPDQPLQKLPTTAEMLNLKRQYATVYGFLRDSMEGATMWELLSVETEWPLRDEDIQPFLSAEAQSILPYHELLHMLTVSEKLLEARDDVWIRLLALNASQARWESDYPPSDHHTGNMDEDDHTFRKFVTSKEGTQMALLLAYLDRDACKMLLDAANVDEDQDYMLTDFFRVVQYMRSGRDVTQLPEIIRGRVSDFALRGELTTAMTEMERQKDTAGESIEKTMFPIVTEYQTHRWRVLKLQQRLRKTLNFKKLQQDTCQRLGTILKAKEAALQAIDTDSELEDMTNYFEGQTFEAGDGSGGVQQAIDSVMAEAKERADEWKRGQLIWVTKQLEKGPLVSSLGAIVTDIEQGLLVYQNIRRLVEETQLARVQKIATETQARAERYQALMQLRLQYAPVWYFGGGVRIAPEEYYLGNSIEPKHIEKDVWENDWELFVDGDDGSKFVANQCPAEGGDAAHSHKNNNSATSSSIGNGSSKEVVAQPAEICTVFMSYCEAFGTSESSKLASLLCETMRKRGAGVNHFIESKDGVPYQVGDLHFIHDVNTSRRVARITATDLDIEEKDGTINSISSIKSGSWTRVLVNHWQKSQEFPYGRLEVQLQDGHWAAATYQLGSPMVGQGDETIQVHVAATGEPLVLSGDRVRAIPPVNEAALRDAKAFICCLDEAYATNPFTRRELEMAVRMGIGIIPVIFPGYEISDYQHWWPAELDILSKYSLFIDLRHGDVDIGAPLVVSALRSVLNEWTPPPPMNNTDTTHTTTMGAAAAAAAVTSEGGEGEATAAAAAAAGAVVGVAEQQYVPCEQCELEGNRNGSFDRRRCLEYLQDWTSAELKRRAEQPDTPAVALCPLITYCSASTQNNPPTVDDGRASRESGNESEGHSKLVRDILALKVKRTSIPCPNCATQGVLPPYCFEREACLAELEFGRGSSVTCKRCHTSTPLHDLLVCEVFLSYSWGRPVCPGANCGGGYSGGIPGGGGGGGSCWTSQRLRRGGLCTACESSWPSTEWHYDTQRIVSELKLNIDTEAGVTCWQDVDRLVGGKDLDKEMEEGIKHADVVILFLDDAYVRSNNCRKEYLFSTKHGKYIIPVLMDRYSGLTTIEEEEKEEATTTKEEKEEEEGKVVSDPDGIDGQLVPQIRQRKVRNPTNWWPESMSSLSQFSPIVMASESQMESALMEICERVQSRFHRAQRFPTADDAVSYMRDYSSWGSIRRAFLENDDHDDNDNDNDGNAEEATNQLHGANDTANTAGVTTLTKKQRLKVEAQLARAFARIDKDGNNLIDEMELTQFLDENQLGLSGAQISTIFEAADIDCDGVLSLDELKLAIFGAIEEQGQKQQQQHLEGNSKICRGEEIVDD